MHTSSRQIAVLSRPNHSLACPLTLSPLLETKLSPEFKSKTLQSLHSFLERCFSMEEFKQVHARIITNGLLGEILTMGKLVAFCAVSGGGDLRYAHELFDRIPQKNRFMWNSLIRGYSNSDRPREAILLHQRMFDSGILPNEFTLPFVLKSCALELAFREALAIHVLVVKLGFGSQFFVQNALLHAYAVCGSIQLARQVFDEIPYRNTASWNSMIDGYSQSGNWKGAFSLYKTMRDLDLAPDEFTLATLLSVCSQTRNLRMGRLVHHYIEISGAKVDLTVGNALIDMYAKCRNVNLAEVCFDRMPNRDVVTWTTMIGAYAAQGLHDMARCWFNRMPEKNVTSWNSLISSYLQYGLCHEALDVYAEMQASNVEPDEATLLSSLSACSQVGNLVMGKKIHHYLRRSNINRSIALLNSLIDMYAKCGPIATAMGIFCRMPEKNVVSWNVMIGALAMHGRAFNAIELFKDMVAEGVPPDGITFVAVLSACTHGGFLEDGLYYFEAMSQIFSVQPEIEHYACMIDLFGRKGDLKRAIDLVTSMPMRPDIVIWGALLGACRIHKKANFGKVVMKQLLELQPCTGGLYVLASNIYCEANRWGDGNKVWNFMKDRGIRKARATSLIEIDDDIHEFMVEDNRHKSSSDIYSILGQLSYHMRSVECSSNVL